MDARDPNDQKAFQLLHRNWREWGRGFAGLIWLNLAIITFFSDCNGLYAPILLYIVAQASAGVTDNYWILMVALIVTFVKAGARLAHKRINVRLFTGISLKMQRALYAKMIAANVAWHGREPPAALAQRIMADIGQVRSALERIVNNAIRDVLMIVAGIASIIYIDWQLSLIAFAIFPIAIWPISTIGRTLRKIGRQTRASIGGVSARLLEGLASIKIAKTYQLEDRLNERSREDLEKLRALEVRAGDHQALIDPMMEVLGGLVIVGVLFFVGWRLEAGQNTLGDFAGFITALLLAGQPLRALGNLAGYVQRGLAATQRIFQILDERVRIVPRPGADPLAVARGEVTFEVATFSYEGDTRPALDNVSLTVPGGTRLALVGRSGAGKSTLFNLIPQLFDPTEGRVLIDGKDISQVALESVRANIALVTQDSILFNDTVGANIAIGARDGRADKVPHEAIERAARAAAAHDFIEALPEGYDTVIGVGGDRLSGGNASACPSRAPS